MTYQICFIDDCEYDIELVKKELKMYTDFEVTCFNSFTEIKSMKKTYDVLFLDIEMPEINGIVLAEKLKQKDVPIVFLSWHEGYVFDSFSVHPMYFVRKEHLTSDLHQCMKILDKMLINEKYFEFVYQYQKHSLRISQIMFFSIEKRMTVITMSNSKCIKCRLSLKNISKEQGFENFIFINNSVLVNLSYIKEVDEYDCILKTGKRLDISYRKKKALIQHFDKYLESEMGAKK